MWTRMPKASEGPVKPVAVGSPKAYMDPYDERHQVEPMKNGSQPGVKGFKEVIPTSVVEIQNRIQLLRCYGR